MAIRGYPGQIISATPPSAFGSGIWTLSNLSKAYNSVVQVFTSTSTWVCPQGVTSVEYLVVAGGGSGGSVAGGGGGGAGGMIAIITATSTGIGTVTANGGTAGASVGAGSTAPTAAKIGNVGVIILS